MVLQRLHSSPGRRACCMFVLLAVLVSLLGAISCSSGSKTADDGKLVKLVFIPLTSDLPLFVAQEKGYFAQEGIKIATVRSANSSEAINAVLAGEVDGSIMNNYNVLFGAELRSPGRLRLFLPCAETDSDFVSYLLAKEGGSIKTIGDLRGKRIGTYGGASQLLALKLFLRSVAGLDPDKDVNLIQVSTSLQTQALSAGQFDALFTVEPYATIARQKYDATSVVDFARGYIMDPFPAGACSFSSDFLKNRPEDAKKVIRALERAVTYIRSFPDSAKAILPAYTPLAPSVAQATTIYRFKGFGEENTDQIQKLADLYATNGILPGNVNVKSMFIAASELVSEKR